MIGYLKASPTTYVLHYQRGRLRREGAGLTFFYNRPTSTLVTIPLASVSVPFVFNETTADFQAVTLQGQLTYRIADPKRVAGLLDYTVKPNGDYASDDPTTLSDRLIQSLQLIARSTVQPKSLREVLAGSDTIQQEVLQLARNDEATRMLGVSVLGVAILAIKPTPETGRALEAEAREALLRESDEAIYARRNAAVEQERRIRESELNTEIAVQEKQRQIRETQIDADISVEERRAALVERRSENERRDADARAYALKVTLEPIRTMDWKTLMAVGGSAADPKLMVALAFRELAENAGKIGELNISPDLLKSLIGGAGNRA